MMMMMMEQKNEKQIRLTQIFSGTPEEAARCCGVAGFDIVHNKKIYNAIRCVSNQHTQVSRFSAIRRSDANAEWFTTRCAAKLWWRLWWRLWWQLRWQLRWQRCECSTTTAAAAYAVVLSQRHLPHDVAPETRRRRHEVSHDVNEAASKTKCRKSVMVMVIVWVWVWVSVWVGWLLLGKRYQECVQHEGALLGGIWMAVMAAFLFLPLPPPPGRRQDVATQKEPLNSVLRRRQNVAVGQLGRCWVCRQI